jgi:hypothetical protein
MAVYSVSMGYCINFSGTSVLDRTSEHLHCLVKEAIETHLNKNNFNGDGGVILSQAWSPITSTLMNEKQDQTKQVLDSA